MLGDQAPCRVGVADAIRIPGILGQCERLLRDGFRMLQHAGSQQTRGSHRDDAHVGRVAQQGRPARDGAVEREHALLPAQRLTQLATQVPEPGEAGQLQAELGLAMGLCPFERRTGVRQLSRQTGIAGVRPRPKEQRVIRQRGVIRGLFLRRQVSSSPAAPSRSRAYSCISSSRRKRTSPAATASVWSRPASTSAASVASASCDATVPGFQQTVRAASSIQPPMKTPSARKQRCCSSERRP